MIVLDLSILNQKGTPMFNSDTFANRPAFGIVGRIFISTDTAAIYRDTGTAWDLIADGGSSSTNIYNSNGTLSADRTVASGGFNLTFNPSTTFDTTLTAANNASSLALFGVNRLSYAAAFSANNIGALYGGASAFALQTFAGSATFANSNVASGGSSVNSIDFSLGGSTITMTQSSGIRVMSGQQNLFQYQGTNSGTITHAAISQNTGFYRPSTATGILTITNAYSHLINALDDYGAGFTFTNRWGIYQAGASDVNYFAATTLIGTTVNNGYKLSVLGDGIFTNLNVNGNSSTNRSLNFCTTLSKRFDILLNATPESGSNSGSNLAIERYNDSGVYIEDAVFINRSNGELKIGKNLIVNGGIPKTNECLTINESPTNPTGVVINNRNTTSSFGISVDKAAVDDGIFAITDLNAALVAFFIEKTTGTVTVQNNLNIGNSVAAAISAPSTHKVAILIGGVQYYLLASNI
jgi:hypothetical protein